MKVWKVFLILFLFFGFSSLVLAATISVTSPNGGECFAVGQSMTVSWIQTESDHFAFYFVKTNSTTAPNSGTWIAHPIPGNSWNWTPSNLDVTENAKIWLESHDANHQRLAIDSSNAVFSVRSNCTKPVISGVSVTSITLNSATITWTTDKSTDSQVEYGSATSYGQTAIQQTTEALTHSVTLSGLTSGSIYHFKVTSKDNFGNQSSSSDATFTTQGVFDNIKPATIKNLTIKSTTDKTVTLTWTSTGDDGLTGKASSYDIRYSFSPIATASWSGAIQIPDELLPSNTGISETFTVTGLKPQTKYYFAIRAIDKGGNTSGIDSTSVTATTNPDIAMPTISNIQVTGVDKKSVSISWTTDELATSELIYGTAVDYKSPPSINSSLTMVHTVKLANLISGTTYHFKVRSSDASKNTRLSDDQTFYTLSISPSTMPTPIRTPTPTPTYVPLPSPTPDHFLLNGLEDGDLVRSISVGNGQNVWIIKMNSDKSKLYRRLILNPRIFNQYGHLKWSNIKTIPIDTLNLFKVSNYVRAHDPSTLLDDQKVYLLEPDQSGDAGIKRHINISGNDFYTKIDSFAVFMINKYERDSYLTSSPITSFGGL